jgi:hypothetical protein
MRRSRLRNVLWSSSRSLTTAVRGCCSTSAAAPALAVRRRLPYMYLPASDPNPYSIIFSYGCTLPLYLLLPVGGLASLRLEDRKMPLLRGFLTGLFWLEPLLP